MPEIHTDRVDMRVDLQLAGRCLVSSLAAATLLAFAASPGLAEPGAAARDGFPAAGSELLFRLAGGNRLRVSSTAYDRAQVAPLVAMLERFPHGPELPKLNLDVATTGEVRRRCGEETMACYDPWEDEMVVDGSEEGSDGMSRISLIAHEYGHHIANHREGGIASAFDTGTRRWSTYEKVCEGSRGGKLFPGDEGLHYWENPGEAFAQTFATLVEPQTPWPYTPLLKPDATALRKVREDVLHPVHSRRVWWRIGSAPGGRTAVSDALPAAHASFRRILKVPFDGQITVRLQAGEEGRYRLTLRDPMTGKLLSQASPDHNGRTQVHYADCGHREVEARAEVVGPTSIFTAEIDTP